MVPVPLSAFPLFPVGRSRVNRETPCEISPERKVSGAFLVLPQNSRFGGGRGLNPLSPRLTASGTRGGTQPGRHAVSRADTGQSSPSRGRRTGRCADPARTQGRKASFRCLGGGASSLGDGFGRVGAWLLGLSHAVTCALRVDTISLYRPLYSEKSFGLFCALYRETRSLLLIVPRLPMEQPRTRLRSPSVTDGNKTHLSSCRTPSVTQALRDVSISLIPVFASGS